MILALSQAGHSGPEDEAEDDAEEDEEEEEDDGDYSPEEDDFKKVCFGFVCCSILCE